ncbi:MAG TPA: tyrosine--tRNA ligase [Anaerolineaceae bacterium]|nr:tyrosine--tRNA ligase [Anaerolineaceae bacterium]HNS36170.1 tyrosine--tRNA ligase [Anaerolineaceae bacterium]HQF61647.1 tyrosine--tRNA ligase [Anaerolineaceae bacterium]HQH84619.1 tyrosine--tRNA ligase [Anaerolineaceae bacterium]
MNIEEQVAYLMQGTEYGDESLRRTMEQELRERLIEAQKEGRPLRVYCGYDPRKADLHLGHTVTMRKLRQFQELGHEVTFVVGTYTSLIGDPSDKDVLRPRLVQEEVEENARTYAEQAFRILDRERTIIRYNAEWLAGITFEQLIHLASNFTIQQFLTREAFRNRWDRNDPIYLHEFFYSIMQAYDAYTLKADVQVGGTDQMFNIVTASRKLMTYLGAKPNIGIILAILPGTDGVVKMSKSLGNHIPINTDAADMYGKMMSIPDMAMPSFARLVTRWTPEQIKAWETGVQSGSLHPRDAKMQLAQEVTASFYGEAEAEQAQQVFVRMFQQREVPTEMDTFALQPGQSVVDVIVAAGLAASKSEARRLVQQKGVRLDGAVLEDPLAPFPHAGVLQVGRRHYLRIV